jgi:hypothetical protein
MQPQYNNHFDVAAAKNPTDRDIGYARGVSMTVKPAVTCRNQVIKLPAREIKWTVLDEEKLNSIDRLHRRSRDSFNTIHSFAVDASKMAALSNDDDADADSRHVMKYIHFTPAVAGAAHSKPQKVGFSCVGLPEVGTFFARYTTALLEESPSKTASPASVSVRKSSLPVHIQKRASSGVLWIVVLEADFVDVVLRHFQVHNVFVNYFHDQRPHSSFLESDAGFFVSICSCNLQNDDRVCKILKTYIFVSAGLCIMFERELMPALDSHESSANFDKNPEVVSNSLMQRIDTVAAVFGSLGAPYLMFELLTENIRLQSSLFRFCSATIFYFKNLIRMNDKDLFDGNIDRKVRVIESCLVLLEKHATGSLLAMQQLSSGHRLLLSKNGKFSRCVSVHFPGTKIFNMHSEYCIQQQLGLSLLQARC